MVEVDLFEKLEKLINEKFEGLSNRIDHIEKKLDGLDDSINRTNDDSQPSLRQQLTMVKWDVSQLKEFRAKFWAVAAAPSIVILIGYAVTQMFLPHSGGGK